MVDVAPRSGDVGVRDLATRAATGKIVTLNTGVWKPPLVGCTPQSMRVGDAKRVVRVDRLLAPTLVVPGLKTKDKKPVTLSDLGPAPFNVSLSLTMLNPHVAGDAVRLFGQAYGAATAADVAAANMAAAAGKATNGTKRRLDAHRNVLLPAACEQTGRPGDRPPRPCFD